MKFIPRLLTVVLGVWLAGFLGTLAFVSAWSDSSPTELKSETVLVFDLSQGIQERRSVPGLSAVVEGVTESLIFSDVTQAIGAASEDAAIASMLLIGSPSAGWAQLNEIRGAILDFQKSGKLVHGSFTGLDEKGYYLASVCDELSMEPLGLLALDGFAAEMLYMKDALNKFGLEMQVSRVGKYKSAVEPFLLSEMSAANKEQMTSLLEDMQDAFIRGAAKSREFSEGDLRQWMQQEGMFDSAQALQVGLIDQVLYRDEVLAHWADAEGDFPQISLNAYIDEQWVDPSTEEAPLTVVFAEGEILDGASEENIAGNTLAKNLRGLRLDPQIKAVVLRVNSPGGSASASEVILREMELLQKAGKTVVVSMGDVAASGGYWIACKADMIMAQENTVTGSIGVFGMFPNAQKAAKDLGLNAEVVKTGPMADINSFWRQKTKGELAVMQVFIDSVYESFLQRVSLGRGLAVTDVQEIAQGRVWSGAEAKELGLVDELGGLEDAIQWAQEHAQLSDLRVDYQQPILDGVEELFLEMAKNSPAPFAHMPWAAAWLATEKPWWLNLDAPLSQRVWARLPYDLNLR
ncbi:MAG: signal peptide peptidase SppA [Planctomycetota bacterium]|nr:signal peptide peptidase SppA [Planctomycetota bacterium]